MKKGARDEICVTTLGTGGDELGYSLSCQLGLGLFDAPVYAHLEQGDGLLDSSAVAHEQGLQDVGRTQTRI